MYFTRGLSKRLKINHAIRSERADMVDEGFGQYLVAVHRHPDYDARAEEVFEPELIDWVSTLKRMRSEFSIDRALLRALHYPVYDVAPYGAGDVDEAYHRSTERKKLTWIFKSIIKNPIGCINLIN